jgi:hypothetical protein
MHAAQLPFFLRMHARQAGKGRNLPKQSNILYTLAEVGILHYGSNVETRSLRNSDHSSHPTFLIYRRPLSPSGSAHFLASGPRGPSSRTAPCCSGKCTHCTYARARTSSFVPAGDKQARISSSSARPATAKGEKGQQRAAPAVKQASEAAGLASACCCGRADGRRAAGALRCDRLNGSTRSFTLLCAGAASPPEKPTKGKEAVKRKSAAMNFASPRGLWKMPAACMAFQSLL